MKRVAETVPWFLTSLGVALLAIAVLLAPVGQGLSRAQGTSGNCSGSSACGDFPGTCTGTTPNAAGSCATGNCGGNPPPNDSCAGCNCTMVMLLINGIWTPSCRCRPS